MDKQKYLVIIKGEDRTEDVLKYQSDKNYIHVRYRNADKVYTYVRGNFEFYKNPIEIDMEQNKIILEQEYLYNVTKVLKFHNYYKIFFKDESTIIAFEWNVKLVSKKDNNEISNNKFEYFKEISQITSIKTEEGMALLTKEYEKINFVEKDTALYKFLNKDKNLYSDIVDNNIIIFPFGANKSQFQAVKNAIRNQISIIEGPPRNR